MPADDENRLSSKIISDLAKSDAGLRQLLGTACEYADIYLLAKKRQKGCDGMGELAMVREEFSASFDGLMKYCRKKGYLSGDRDRFRG